MTATSATFALAALAGITALLASIAGVPANAAPARAVSIHQAEQVVEAQYYRPGQFGAQRGCRTVMRYVHGQRIMRRVCS